MATSQVAQGAPSASLSLRYEEVRGRTERLCDPLEPEDMTVSSMPDVSPTKWHLAHTSWFFETFVLSSRDPAYRSPDPRYAYLFNSYYVQAGERHCRAQRGLVTRPTVSEVFRYRRHVDEHMRRLLDRDGADPALDALVTLGLHHEQQHQELILTDIEHVFWMNPIRPAYHPDAPSVSRPQHPAGAWRDVGGGIYSIGHAGDGFAFDNESPRHRTLVEDYRISSRLVTNGEFLEFIEDGGYRRADLWLAAGLALVREQQREAPLYWERGDDGWAEFTLAGMQPLDTSAPVCHVSYYEADAFARWAGARLPTEAEWEIAAGLHPDMPGLFGARWQWTQSAYVAYPGYSPARGALGEYNGKWMSDQWVLRGSSLATAPGHARVTYRNFFPSDTRWQFTGIRLAA
ncbi:MAG: ergothioneine biosynthesis protein EgtB [Gemmatimonadales bacterium]